MTPEQKREQLLKRILPAMFITVIYFVFVSGFMEEEKEKAEKKYIALAQQGLAPESVKSKRRQIDSLQLRLSELKQKKQQLQKKIQQLAGFMLEGKNHSNTATRVSEILAAHQVIVIKETAETLDAADLSKAMREVKKWLSPGKTLTVQQMTLRGDYLALYNALLAIEQHQLAVLPVSFSMTSLDDDSGLQWRLALWL